MFQIIFLGKVWNMYTNYHDLRITQICNRSASACLGLAAQTFGKDSPQFHAVHAFHKEKRAGYVAMIRNCVVGFIVYDNRGMDAAQVLALTVSKANRRQGIGGQLLGRVVRLPRREIIVTVDERNLDAQLFLRSQGFRAAVGIEDGHYIFKRNKVGVAFPATEVQPSLQPVGAES
jgi:ribosomal protein S18 acetylase RimI-like enzyme